MNIIRNLFTKRNISLFILLFVNFTFVVKYGSRYTAYAPFIAVVVVIFQLLLWTKRKYLIKISKQLNRIDLALLLGFTIVFSYLFIKMPVLSLMVDRATVISSFWENYFGNEYVYFAKSHRGNPPGPMPFYYIIALPFYLLGELGYFSIMGVVVFYLIVRNIKPAYYKTTALLLLFSSFFYLWEVISRSNLILNGTLVLSSLLYMLSERKHTIRFIIITGVLTGLFISTRNVFAIAYIIAFMYALLNRKFSFKQCLSIGIIAIATFILTFVPFVAGHWDDFMVMNPFIVQSDYLIPFAHTLVFIALAFAVSFMAKSALDVYFYSAVVLFLTIIWYITYHIIHQGFYVAYHKSWADISYLMLCIPFALYYLIKQQSEIEASNKDLQ